MDAAGERADARRPRRRRSSPWSRRRRARRRSAPTSSSRCATPANVRSAAAHRGGGRRRARASPRRAAIAFSRLWAPRSRMSATRDDGLAAPGQPRRRGRRRRRRRRGAEAATRRDRARPRTSAASSAVGQHRDRVRRPGGRRSRASPRGRPRSVPWRSRWSGARLSSTAASGANASVSSSWNDDASQTTVAAGSSVPASVVSAVPTLPATATGSAGRAVDRGRRARSSSSCRWSP